MLIETLYCTMQCKEFHEKFNALVENRVQFDLF